MTQYSLAHLSDAVLLRGLKAILVHERETTAALLAHIAEVDARKLYAPAGYSSMFVYCVEELRLSEDAAAKRIQAARAARRFPVIFTAVAEGRLHLSGVCLLAPHVTPENLEELLQAATHRRKSEIEELLAKRFPLGGPRAECSIRAIPSGIPVSMEIAQHAPGHVGDEPGRADEHAPGHVGDESVRSDEHAPGHVEAVERYLVQVTIDKSTQERLLYAQALLSHAVPAGDLGQVFRRALEALITHLEKRKIGGVKPRRRSSTLRAGTISRPRARYIPAKIRRAVWERDKGQCTFRSTAGRRCNERRLLEFDHAEPVARGGRATVEGMRLRCRTHNQYEAERAFGSDFMRLKREEASRKRHENVRLPARPPQVKDELTQDVLAGLRGLGCRGEEARRAAQFSASLESGTLEERMRAALGFVARRSRAHAPVT